MVVVIDPLFLAALERIKNESDEAIKVWPYLSVEQQLDLLDKTMLLLTEYIAEQRGL